MMRVFLVSLGLVFAAFTAPLRAAAAPDAALTQGLQTCVSNGIDAGVRLWYTDRQDLGAEMSNRVLAASAKLGPIVDSEIVATQTISKRVTRYYLALYFTQGPLWLRLERYESRDKAFYLPLRCSTNPDDILPGYVTDFYR